MASNRTRRNIANPWPRLILAAAMTVWAGSNMWTAVFRWGQINAGNAQNQFVAQVLTILFTVVPAVIAIYLVWTVVVGPDDPRYNRQKKAPPNSDKKQPAKKSRQ